MEQFCLHFFAVSDSSASLIWFTNYQALYALNIYWDCYCYKKVPYWNYTEVIMTAFNANDDDDDD